MRSQRFAGDHVIISGGAAGVGAAATRMFAQEGARVSIVDINVDAAQRLAERLMEAGGEALPLCADVSKAEDVSRAVQASIARFGTPKALFNHAGTLVVGPFLETTLEDWRRVFAVNLDSMFLMTQAVLPSMIERGSGAIVNTSSVSASLATPMEVAYCTTKSACHMFTKAIATEYREQGIRCNAVCPGFIRTAHGLRELAELQRLGVDVTEAAIAELQGRICEPEEVAEVVLFLASQAASFVNGETLYVDNGLMART